MIGYLQGKIVFSDGQDTTILISTGIGYQVCFNGILAEGSEAGLFISHVIKEASQSLYGFTTLREKKIFEILLTVKGVGPKSAFSMISSLGAESICQSILLDNKKILQKAPGVGAKAASQIVLDLSDKVKKLKMYGDIYHADSVEIPAVNIKNAEEKHDPELLKLPDHKILSETLMACKELGFSEDQVLAVANKVIKNHEVNRAEQLVHLVLREM